MSYKIVVAYRTRPSDIEVPTPEFKAAANVKDPLKIQAQIAAKHADFMASLAGVPYTGTFDEVRIYDQKTKDTVKFKYRAPDSGKSAACLAIRSWLLKRHPAAWPHSTDRPGKPEAIFIGHDMRTFIKILGIECSLPANQPQAGGKPDPLKSNALPLSMWYGQSDHRDIFEAVNPKPGIPWGVVLQVRDIVAEGWTGPGTNVEQDLTIATQFAAQLGMFLEE